MKLCLLTCVLALASNVPINAASAQDALNATQMEALADRARSFVPRDEFATPPALPSVEGKRFEFTVTPLKRGPGNMICNGFPSWGYWPADGKLEVGVWESVAMKSEFVNAHGTGRMFVTTDGPGDTTSFITLLSFRCQKSRLPSYEATNAFGAKFTIEKSKEVITAIGGLGDDSWRPYWTAQTTGNDARLLSQNIRVRMGGALKDWASGRPVICGTKSGAPTANFRIDESLEVCMFKGEADLFEIVDARDGKVLFSKARW